MEVRITGVQTKIYSLFPLGIKEEFLGNLMYPKGTGLFYLPELKGNLVVLDDAFLKGILVLLLRSLKRLRAGESLEEEKVLLKEALNVIDSVISNPSYYPRTESYKKVKKLGESFRLSQKSSDKKVLPIKPKDHFLSYLKRDKNGSLFSLGAVRTVKDGAFENALWESALISLLVPPEVTSLFTELVKKTYGTAAFYYLLYHVKPFSFLYAGGEKKRFYTLKPKNFKKKYTLEKIWKRAQEIQKSAGQPLLGDDVKEVFGRLLKEISVYYRYGNFKKALKSLAEKGMILKGEECFFAETYERGETEEKFKVLRGHSLKGEIVKVNFTKAKSSGSILPLGEFLSDLLEGRTEKDERGKLYKGSFLYLAVLLAGAFYLWHREENLSFLFITEREKEVLTPLQEFYRFFRGTCYRLPPFPFQGIYRDTYVSKLKKPYVLNNLLISQAKKTKELEIKFERPMSQLEGYLILEKSSDFVLPLSASYDRDSIYYGLKVPDLTALSYTVYRFRTFADGKVYIKVVGTGVRLPWGDFAYRGEDLVLPSPVVLLTEVKEREDSYGFISSLFGAEKDFKDRFLEVKTCPIALIHTKKDTVRDAYVLYKEDMGAVREFVKEALKVDDRKGFVLAVFYPMTYPQEKLVGEFGFVTSNGNAFYGNVSASFWTENSSVLIPLFVSLGVYENETSGGGLAKLKDRTNLRKGHVRIKRNGRVYYFGTEYSVYEGTARLMELFRGVEVV